MSVNLRLVRGSDSVIVGMAELIWSDDTEAYVWEEGEWAFQITQDGSKWVAEISRIGEVIWSGSSRPSPDQAAKELKNFIKAATMTFSNLC